MTNATHTPGPWRIVTATVQQDPSGLPCRAIVGPGDAFVALLDKLDAVSAHGSANARLIAAAPDLLAALEAAEIAMANMPTYFPPNNPARLQIRAAIAKARGTVEG